MNKVYCIGEILIDMVSTDRVGLKNAKSFEKKAGGAPANVACAVAKMGKEAEFMGQIGNDFFGEYLYSILEKYNIKTNLCYKEGNTTLAFVALDKDGERDFSFMRGCDKDYCYKKIDFSCIDNKDILHFGSATGLLDGNLKETYIKLFEYAKEKNIFISFDPNYRENLIKNNMLDKFIEDCKFFIKNSDFIKMSDEEIKLIAKKDDLESCINYIHSLGGKIIAITLGKNGTLLSFNNNIDTIPSIKINQIDSTGAGDAFVGSMLALILDIINQDKYPTFEQLKDICLFSNKVGAITCTNYGAMDSIPTKEQVLSI
ncbi:carbohydrate kinase family protein [[Clostridium] colinum]|uniref:carbohydrate kinase family protein n=1 Tax=[Clostridium] colinum TaxID=36835 RepID=UPI0020252480|nr:carbohydrate kinase [[Clostridium] colinum]